MSGSEFDIDAGADSEYAELFSTDKLSSNIGEGRDTYQSAFDNYRGQQRVRIPERSIKLRYPDGEQTHITGMDMDFHVRFPAGSPGTFEVTLWNLQPSTWGKISRGATVDLEAGWKDGPTERFIRGEIRTTNAQSRRGDDRFRLRGVDITATKTDRAFSKTWRGVSPTDIVRQIGDELGLQPGLLDASPPIPSSWAITAEQPVSHWLNELRKQAEAQTGEPWIWSTERGELSFHRQHVRQSPIAELSQLDSMLDYLPATYPQTGPYARTDSVRSQPESVHTAHEFISYLEPSLRRGRKVRVHELPEPDRQIGRNRKALRHETEAKEYALADFEIATGSTGFRHHARGTLVPLPENRGDR